MALLGTSRQHLMVPKLPLFWFLICPLVKSQLLSPVVAMGILVMVTVSMDKMWHHRRNSIVREMTLGELIRRRIITSHRSLAGVRQCQAHHFLI